MHLRQMSQNPQAQVLPVSAQIQVREAIIDLEVARSPQAQALGLMYRQSLPDNRGMLFPFDPPQQVRFWMKNVPIPLDMVFLQAGTVKAIASQVPPCRHSPCPTYGPDIPVDQVLELRGGRAEELGLKVGDRLVIHYLN